MAQWKKRTRALVLALAGLTALAGASAKAERAGVTAAVNTDTRGTPPGGTVRQITLGQEIVRNEVIETDANGQAQILMLDRTALTIGPNSRLVIDKFIYDPSTKNGEMKLTLSRGLMRFTGGALSKKKPVNVSTPVATVGIRGGMGLIEVPSEGQARAGFLFGREMTVTIQGILAQRIGRPGFGTNIEDGTASSPRRWTGETIHKLMSKLQGRRGRTGGLTRQPSAKQTNDAAGDAFPAQDGQTINQAATPAFSGSGGFDQSKVSSITAAVNQTRPFNDLVLPEEPYERKHRRDKERERDGKHWERKLLRFLCECRDPEIPTVPITVEYLSPALLEQLRLAGITEGQIDLSYLAEIYRDWRISLRNPEEKRHRHRNRDRERRNKNRSPEQIPTGSSTSLGS